MDAVKKEMQALGMYKVEFALSAQMTKRTEKGEITRTKHYFKDDDGRVFHNASKEKIKEEFKEVIKKVKKKKNWSPDRKWAWYPFWRDRNGLCECS